MSTRRPKVLERIGWREWVSLPELDVSRIKAKIDTGARTSSLHAHGLRIEEVDGVKFAKFEVHPVQRSRASSVSCSLRIDEFREVRSSSGVAERRPVIQTLLRIGGHDVVIEATLARRDAMGFRMLIGREALRGRFLVDPGASFLFEPAGESATNPANSADIQPKSSKAKEPR